MSDKEVKEQKENNEMESIGIENIEEKKYRKMGKI